MQHTETSSDDRNGAMLCHLLGLAGFVVPFGQIIGPLIVWLMKRETSPFIDLHGRAVLNFQISMVIWLILCIPLVFVVIGIFGMIALSILSLVCTIIGAIKASGGEYYVYPISIRFLG